MFIVYKTEQEAGTCNEKVERVYLSSLHCSLLLFDFLVLGGKLKCGHRAGSSH